MLLLHRHSATGWAECTIFNRRQASPLRNEGKVSCRSTESERRRRACFGMARGQSSGKKYSTERGCIRKFAAACRIFRVMRLAISLSQSIVPEAELVERLVAVQKHRECTACVSLVLLKPFGNSSRPKCPHISCSIQGTVHDLGLFDFPRLINVGVRKGASMREWCLLLQGEWLESRGSR